MQAGTLICGLKNNIKVFQNEQNNPVLVKLAKEFGTSSSKKEAILVLQQIAMVMEDTAKKVIRDVARIAQGLQIELPPCCSTALGSSQICQNIEMQIGPRPGIVPKLEGAQSNALTPARKPTKIKSKVTEGMSMDNYNYE